MVFVYRHPAIYATHTININITKCLCVLLWYFFLFCFFSIFSSSVSIECRLLYAFIFIFSLFVCSLYSGIYFYCFYDCHCRQFMQSNPLRTLFILISFLGFHPIYACILYIVYIFINVENGSFYRKFTFALFVTLHTSFTRDIHLKNHSNMTIAELCWQIDYWTGKM